MKRRSRLLTAGRPLQVPDYHSHVRSDVFHLIPRGGRLLDVGGGDGATAAALKSRGHAEQIGVIDRVPPAQDNVLDFDMQGDITDPAFIGQVGTAHGPFDTILCLDILEHLPDPWATVRQLHGLLAPNGRIIASIPNVRHFSVLLPLLFKGQWRYRDAGVLDRTHLRFFVRETACELMTCSGLVLDRIEAIPPSARRRRWLLAASFGLLRNFLSLQYIVKVRRAD